MSNKVFELEVQRATAEKLERYGKVIGTDPSVPKLPIEFYGGSVEVRVPANFESAGPPQLSVCKVQPRDMSIDYMERHPQHTQSFLPLGGKPFVAVLAPPSKDLPTPDQLEAFLFDGSAGFMMHKDVWHEFPFAVEADTDLIILLSAETNANLQADPDGMGEAHGPDLDKRNYKIRMQTDVQLRL